jgi:hypothetical protein
VAASRTGREKKSVYFFRCNIFDFKILFITIFEPRNKLL